MNLVSQQMSFEIKMYLLFVFIFKAICSNRIYSISITSLHPYMFFLIKFLYVSNAFPCDFIY